MKKIKNFVIINYLDNSLIMFIIFLVKNLDVNLHKFGDINRNINQAKSYFR